MRAFHNDAAIKAEFIAKVKTRAVGCTLEIYNYSCCPIELGIPVEVAYLEDKLFELLLPADAQKWPERFLKAIPVGANLSRVWPKFAVWMLTDETHGVLRHAEGPPATRAAIAHVAALWQRVADREQVPVAKFRNAAKAMGRAAANAADAVTPTAAWAAATSRTVAGTVAAATTWAARAGGAAWAIAACDKLVELLRAQKTHARRIQNLH